MAEIDAGNLDGLEGHEVTEALARASRCVTRLATKLSPGPATAPVSAAGGDKLLYDTAEAARYLSCAKSFIRRAYRDGALPFVRQGVRYVRFTKDALDAFAMSGQIL